jgi:hypothetical protein
MFIGCAVTPPSHEPNHEENSRPFNTLLRVRIAGTAYSMTQAVLRKSEFRPDVLGRYYSKRNAGWFGKLHYAHRQALMSLVKIATGTNELSKDR